MKKFGIINRKKHQKKKEKMKHVSGKNCLCKGTIMKEHCTSGAGRRKRAVRMRSEREAKDTTRKTIQTKSSSLLYSENNEKLTYLKHSFYMI